MINAGPGRAQIDLPKETLDRLQSEFEVAVYEPARKNGPERPEILEGLAIAYYNLARLDEAVASDSRLVELLPFEPEPLYRLARSLARTGRIDDAIRTLERAFSLGFDDYERIAADHAFDRLKSTREFREILESRGQVI